MSPRFICFAANDGGWIVNTTEITEVEVHEDGGENGCYVSTKTRRKVFVEDTWDDVYQKLVGGAL